MNKIICGDAIKKLKELESKSINMCMTSPPYWALRDYGSTVEIIWDEPPQERNDPATGCPHFWKEKIKKETKLQAGNPEFQRPWREEASNTSSSQFCFLCGAWKGQLGLEPTFDLYIKHLCDIFDAVKRVLRDDGTCWINIGDTYGGLKGGGPDKLEREKRGIQWKDKSEKFITRPPKANVPDKSLCMIPFRFAIEMVNRGWILRNTIIWYKRNCMPSSVKDRFTVDFEYLFFFSKKKNYYFKTQYEKASEVSIERYKYGWDGNIDRDYISGPQNHLNKHLGKEENRQKLIEQGRNKRTVWTINPQPFSEAHFAVYPEELCETPIKAGCPKGGIVLDPFFGSGTTGIVALKQNKKFIGIELNKEYIEIADKRLKPFLEQTKLK
ncbi:hypothetical protein LCGC14_1014740 [marine sediment metagenome]|uniref:site-specific DNA-methyltransferase (cytosine-N(4)-specific) n=1 Tax=marine sediment metagenome TaxID=412755 RepID=A0A0F9QHG7_9ZZZZ